MRKFKAVDAVCIMVLAGIVGFFMGAFLDNSMGEWMKRKSERKRRENAKEV